MLCFDLSGITMMGRAAFLLVYAAVNAGHLLALNQTEANATIVCLSLLTCLAVFDILGVDTYQQQPAAIAALVLIVAVSFVVEWVYRRLTGRRIKTERRYGKKRHPRWVKPRELEHRRDTGLGVQSQHFSKLLILLARRRSATYSMNSYT